MPDKPTQEDIESSFRSALTDTAAVAEKLAPHCKTIEELVDVVKLALTSDGQLRLVLSLMKDIKSK